MNKIIYVILLFIVLFQSACIKSSVIGGDILKDEEILVEFSDTSTLMARSLRNDSIKVFPSSASSFNIGEFHNTTFGYAKASVVCNFRTTGSLPSQNIDNIDSIVLTMILDTSLISGDKFSNHTISIYELEEDIKTMEKDSFYSNRAYQISPNKLGEIQITPILDSITIIEPGLDTVEYSEQIRINLDKSWGHKFLNDTNQIKNDTVFKEMFKGLYIESTSDLSSMISLKRLDSKKIYKTRIDVYYTLKDTLRKSTFLYDDIASSFEHDYSSSNINNYFEDSSIGDSLLFVQGMEGVQTELSVPYLNFLKGKNINKAELVLYSLDENTTEIKTPIRLVTKYINTDGDLKYIEDYSFLSDSRQYDKNIYFGYKTEVEEDGIEVSKYTINLTMHIKALMRDDIFETKLFISTQNRLYDPGFATLSGVNRSNLKTKLKITYSNID